LISFIHLATTNFIVATIRRCVLERIPLHLDSKQVKIA
jgi:hypothetical protein